MTILISPALATSIFISPGLQEAQAVPTRSLGAPLWDMAGAVPSLDLNFAATKNLVDATTGAELVTFTRTSDGTATNSSGNLIVVPANTPRFDHDPMTGESLGLLVEEQRTNFATQSETFSGWTVQGLTQSTDAILNPAGSFGAQLFVEDTTTATHRLFLSPITGQLAHSFSVWVKSASGTRLFYIESDGPTGTRRSLRFNLQSGTVNINPGDWSGVFITPYPNGWFRLGGTITDDGGSTIFILGSSNGVAASYTGDGTSGFYLWGAQLEGGLTASSYIPTTAAAATRAADVASISGSNLDGGAGNTLFAQFRSPASGTRAIVSLDDNTANERIELLTSGTDPKLLVTDGGSTQADIDAGAIVANTTARLAARFAANNFAASVSGGAEVVDTSGTIPTVDRVRIGSNQAGGYLNGTIGRVTRWDRLLELLSGITG
jgi:hypothetical protein